ncbi:MAG: peptide ABC transporter substrate-binding protein [Chloroflexi bacterium AL-W]|nr:peptide ABC transporter substrate-binding protein [Chloroflexi bacterium AL-N1]NOK70860.1 peptide ABC transporter substrate-binding protein [Chloroflexi bacterium AL-N10]NOK78420.1 peptide ABC transporter substrate-binding protein [Chloroflexi bacterium AL-N5]NOK85401.1 peptide ABC transporter substrate-binding protein [Chloroflexi bacterium AL-W]NOK92677.1 peptide ABC transporter substrate-binding protein [Chloroflexi bacterium AL-N15]
MVAHAKVLSDQEECIRLYEEVGEIFISSIPGPFMYNQANIFLVKPFVQNYTTTSADSSTGWPG